MLQALDLRKDFPALHQDIHGHPLVYLDNAATSQKPRCVIDAVQHFYERDNSNVHRGVHELSSRATVAYESTRTRTARFINASSADEVIFTRGTTESINLVAQAWGGTNLQLGDVILLTEMEHHSNIVPWQLLARRTGSVLMYVPVRDGELDQTELEKLLPRAKLFACTHVSNTLGTINPIAEICQRARRLGVTTLIDAAQSSGHRPLDVQAIGCDFLAFSSHKMCGPTGVGVLFGRSELLKAMEPYQGGGDMISSVDFFKSEWKQPPYKFEAGTPNISGVIGLGAAVDYLERIGRDRIWRYDEELSNYAYEQLVGLKGIRLFGPKTKRASLVSFLMEGIHAHDVVTIANESGVALRGGNHCNQPLMKKLGVESTIRASFYFYNTPAEIDRFIAVLLEIQGLFSA